MNVIIHIQYTQEKKIEHIRISSICNLLTHQTSKTMLSF